MYLVHFFLLTIVFLFTNSRHRACYIVFSHKPTHLTSYDTSNVDINNMFSQNNTLFGLRILIFLHKQVFCFLKNSKRVNVKV